MAASEWTEADAIAFLAEHPKYENAWERCEVFDAIAFLRRRRWASREIGHAIGRRFTTEELMAFVVARAPDTDVLFWLDGRWWTDAYSAARAAIAGLTDQERRVVDPMLSDSIDAIARRLKTTRAEARRIEAEAVRKLREAMKGHEDDARES